MGYRLPRTVYLLMALQALSMCTAPLFFLCGGIIGNDLAPRPGLATLPVALVILGTALSVVSVTRLMQQLGRKRVFMLGALLGSASGLLAAFALAQGSFRVFCAAALVAGISIAIAQQYRFAAIDVVPPLEAGRATSRVLLAGLIAAYLGPELVVWSEQVALPRLFVPAVASHRMFSGAFVLLSYLGLLVMALVAIAYRDTRPAAEEQFGLGRPWREILRNRRLWLAIVASAMGYAMMSFMMTATPLNMHAVNGHSLLDTKWVIQSHIVAMFAPSFFSGWLIHRFGHGRVIAAGALAYLVCLAIALAGQHLMHYWWSMVLLGVGWNFLFVGGTALLPLCYRPQERFRVQSLNEFSVFGMQALAALSSGVVLSFYGWGPLVLLSLLMVLIVAATLWLARGTGSLAADSGA